MAKPQIEITVLAFNKAIASELTERIANLSKYDSFVPSSYQQTLIDFVLNGQGNGIVQAVAGSGKTTTIMQALNELRKKYGNSPLTSNDWKGVQYGKIIYKAKTTHSLFASLAFKAGAKFTTVETKTNIIIRGGGLTISVKGKQGSYKKDIPVIPQGKAIYQQIKAKASTIGRQVYGDQFNQKIQARIENVFIGLLIKLVAIGKNTGTGFFHQKPNTVATFRYLWQYYDLSPYIKDKKLANAIGKMTMEGKTIHDFAVETLAISQSITDMWDYDDYFYMSAYLELYKKYNYKQDFIFVDECQDTNLVTQYLIKWYLKKSGRAIAVGDVSQAIYLFRGADANAMQSFKNSYNATEIPLSLCYRCGKDIIETTNQIYDYTTQSTPYTDIQALNTAPDGLVYYGSTPFSEMTNEQIADLFDVNTGVVCRKNAPLLQLARRLFLKKIPVVFMGRDTIGKAIAKQMTNMKKKFAKGVYELDDGSEITFPKGFKHSDKKAFQEYMAIYKNGMDAYLDKMGTKQDKDDFDDEIAGYDLIFEGLGDKKLTNDNIYATIDEMFSESQENGAVTLCSVHRSKGLEFHRCVILNFNDAFLPPFPMPQHVYRQECNMVYVAYTRAERELVFIDM